MQGSYRAPLYLVLALAASAASSVPGLAEGRQDGRNEASAVVERFKVKDPGLVKAFRDAHGYAVFPTVKKGGLGLGGARGKGYVYERGRLVGRSLLTQVTIGLQLGGQAYSEVVFFKDQAAFEDFKQGRLKLDAQASAVALTARAAGDLAYRSGVAIVTMAKGGLMYEASVGGQKFSFDAVDDRS
jgi:lipid-binding SYLF domain-containing protein